MNTRTVLYIQLKLISWMTFTYHAKKARSSATTQLNVSKSCKGLNKHLLALFTLKYAMQYKICTSYSE